MVAADALGTEAAHAVAVLTLSLTFMATTAYWCARDAAAAATAASRRRHAFAATGQRGDRFDRSPRSA